MENFIKENISLVNKKNLIVIKIGSTLYENTLNCKFKRSRLQTLMENLSTILDIKKAKVKNLVEYKHENSVIAIASNKYSYKFTYTNPKLSIVPHNKNHIKLIFLKILNYDNLSSIYKYHSIENKQVVTFDVSGLISIEISNYNDTEEYFTVSIIIKKPNDYKLIVAKIKEILDFI